MDLNSILEKTKKTSDRIRRTREPVQIATLDRPYETAENAVSETDNKLVTKWQQSGDKQVTNRQQTGDNKTVNWLQSGDKVASKVTTEVVTNWQQTGNKVVTKWSFSVLTGLQRNIVIFVFHECKKALSKTTEPLTLEYISHLLKSTKKSVKTSIYRLEQKGFLLRVEYKNGRGGWTKYELPKDVFHELLHNESGDKLTTNWQQTGNKLASEVTTQLTTTPLSSSSINIITTTTEESPEWKKIDWSSLEDIGFTQSHITQLQRSGTIKVEHVQESINHFAYDLKHNGKTKEIKTSPIGYFMGIMKRVGVYTAPDNYESEQEKGMRVFLETKKRQQEKQEVMENELLELSYKEWSAQLTEEKRIALLPDDAKNSKYESARIAALKTHFKNTIWPSKRNQIASENL